MSKGIVKMQRATHRANRIGGTRFAGMSGTHSYAVIYWIDGERHRLLQDFSDANAALQARNELTGKGFQATVEINR